MSDGSPFDAPLLETLTRLAAANPVRMHMPGHKGITLDGLSAGIDFTELPVTGDLYRDGSGGPLREAERKWADVFGVPFCLFLTGGSSQGICAALSALAQPGESILLDRCCHTSFTHGMALLDLRPVYLTRALNGDGLPAPPGPAAAESALKNHPEIKTACITSPTYYGMCSDIPVIADIVHKTGARLFVDSAHGAHFPFAGMGSPANGADIFVCSAHKTLPALGQSALLFCKDERLCNSLRGASALFGTSSPSYLLMASLDAARAWMETEGCDRLTTLLTTISKIRHKYNNIISCGGNGDAFRLVADTGHWGYTGPDAAAIWREEFNLWPEMAGGRFVTLIVTACDGDGGLETLDAAMERLRASRRPAIIGIGNNHALSAGIRALTPREALLGQRERVVLAQAGGRVAASDILIYPPGIPLCAAGEIIDAAELERAGADMNAMVDVCL